MRSIVCACANSRLLPCAGAAARLDEEWGRRSKERPMAHGILVDGVWQTQWHDTKSTGGHFKRTEPKFRNWVTPDGSAGPSGSGGFAAARGAHHLYASLACPCADRHGVLRKA